jgi:general secretion pathway protein G
MKTATSRHNRMRPCSAQGARRKHRQSQHAFTLVELLVVMVILALLASMVMPNLFRDLEKAERQAATVQLKQIDTALKDFRLDMRRYPTTEEGLEILWDEPGNLERWNGPYLEKALKGDPWGHPYVYKAPGPDDRPYQLKSYGPDGQEGGTDENADISVWD